MACSKLLVSADDGKSVGVGREVRRARSEKEKLSFSPGLARRPTRSFDRPHALTERLEQPTIERVIFEICPV